MDLFDGSYEILDSVCFEQQEVPMLRLVVSEWPFAEQKIHREQSAVGVKQFLITYAINESRLASRLASDNRRMRFRTTRELRREDALFFFFLDAEVGLGGALKIHGRSLSLAMRKAAAQNTHPLPGLF